MTPDPVHAPAPEPAPAPERPRLFVAAWPSPEVVSALAALSRPTVPGLRWSAPEQWHVTLTFLGSADLDATLAAFRGAVLSPGPVTARLGPSTGRFGNRVVHVPVAGLDEVASAVRAALPGDGAPFRGHLTLARARERRGVDLSSVVGVPLDASFLVDEVTLVVSHLGEGPARYEVVDRRRL
jgi:2'-5' RNA ligase